MVENCLSQIETIWMQIFILSETRPIQISDYYEQQSRNLAINELTKFFNQPNFFNITWNACMMVCESKF